MTTTINNYKLPTPQNFAKECLSMGLNHKEFEQHLYQHFAPMDWVYDCQAEWKKQGAQL